jgi:hypothetical protein
VATGQQVRFQEEGMEGSPDESATHVNVKGDQDSRGGADPAGATVEASAPAVEATDALAPSDAAATDPSSAGGLVDARHIWWMVAGVVALAIAGASMPGWLGRGGPSDTQHARPATAQAAMVGGGTATIVENVPASRPKWRTMKAGQWVSNRARSLAFELQADNTVSSWMASARPVLVVRCLSGTTEAFVFTQIAPAIEPLGDNRTVRVSFDGASATTERWPASAERDALFAPDGVAFARRLTRAHTLQFEFTPHNSPAATVAFDVHGFDAHIKALARACRWKGRDGAGD